MSFRYPVHPNTNRTDPFQDKDGKNPFADEDPPTEPAADNPYAASALTDPVTHPPAACQIVYAHRGRTVFWLGVVGCSCSLGAALGVAGLLAQPTAAAAVLVMLCPVLLIVSLTTGGTAWMFGRQDLGALRAGAMDPAGMKMTRHGHRLGVASTVISIGALSAYIVAVLVA